MVKHNAYLVDLIPFFRFTCLSRSVETLVGTTRSFSQPRDGAEEFLADAIDGCLPAFQCLQTF